MIGRAVACGLALAWASCAWAADTAANGSSRCTYTTSQWDVATRRSSHVQVIDKPYAEVSADERDPNEPRCSVCREDQETVDPRAAGIDVLPFRICGVYAGAIRAMLRDVATENTFVIKSIVGYRVGRTRGPVVNGLRTAWSNHAFGAAIDINAADNGLYGNCEIPRVTSAALATCTLRVGGPWDPVRRPRTTITPMSSLYRAMRKFWRWGGEITGATRDTMHFSPTGY